MRNGISAFYEYIPENADLVLNIPSHVVYDFVLGRGTIRQALESGDGTAEGDLSGLEQFASYFDFSKTNIRLAGR